MIRLTAALSALLLAQAVSTGHHRLPAPGGSTPPSGSVSYVKGCTGNPCSLASLTSSAAIIVTINGNSSSATLADSAGGTMPGEYTGWPRAVNGGVWYTHMWVVPNLSGNHTFTVAYGGEFYSQTLGVALSGASTSSPIDAVAYNTSGYVPVCSAVTPSSSGEYVVSFVTGTEPSVATNMTNPSDANTGDVVFGYASASGTSAFTPAWSLTGGAGDFGCSSITIH